MSFANTDIGIPGPSYNTPFFGYFPTIDYDINNTINYRIGPHEKVTDIFFRFNIIRNVINDVSAYYVYDILDSDTPELLAESVYGDKGAGWIIIYANRMFDPQFDWPLQYNSFQKMIIDKYGSIGNAQGTIHHYEKVITRVNEFYGTTSVTRFVVDGTRETQQVLNVPYNYYTPYTVTTHRTADSNVYTADDYEIPYLTADLMYDDLQVVSKSGSVAYANEYNSYNINGHTVNESIHGEAITNYEYELRKNDEKKIIKIIKAEYYQQIMKEYKDIMGITINSRRM